MTQQQAAYVPDIVKNSMLVAWREICADTNCHPLDIEHGKGRYLEFEPRHWAQMAGEIVAVQVAKLFEQPEGFVLVPIQPTEAMLEELARIGDGPAISGAEVWGYMLAAAAAAKIEG